MTLATQPSLRPTNKLTAAALIAPAVTEVWGALLPYLCDTCEAFAGPDMSMLVGAFAALAVGWFIPDKANVPA